MLKEEHGVINLLAEAWNAFVALPVLHDHDRVEFMRAIHAAQNIVMSRMAMRELAEKDLDDMRTEVYNELSSKRD